jgi:hypothetical protein
MDANYWKDYRKTAGDLTWRLAAPEDQPAIDRIRETSERLLNEKQKAPNLFAAPVMLALVAEDAAGSVVDALYVEAQVEIVKMGLSSESFTATMDIEKDLYAWLRGIGIKRATVRTRSSLMEVMRPVLSFLGFECEDDDFSHWKRDL